MQNFNVHFLLCISFITYTFPHSSPPWRTEVRAGLFVYYNVLSKYCYYRVNTRIAKVVKYPVLTNKN